MNYSSLSTWGSQFDSGPNYGLQQGETGTRLTYISNAVGIQQKHLIAGRPITSGFRVDSKLVRAPSNDIGALYRNAYFNAVAGRWALARGDDENAAKFLEFSKNWGRQAAKYGMPWHRSWRGNERVSSLMGQVAADLDRRGYSKLSQIILGQTSDRSLLAARQRAAESTTTAATVAPVRGAFDVATAPVKALEWVGEHWWQVGLGVVGIAVLGGLVGAARRRGAAPRRRPPRPAYANRRR